MKEREFQSQKDKHQLIKLMTDDTNPTKKPGVSSCSPEWLADPAPFVAHVMLCMLGQSRWSVEIGRSHEWNGKEFGIVVSKFLVLFKVIVFWWLANPLRGHAFQERRAV